MSFITLYSFLLLFYVFILYVSSLLYTMYVTILQYFVIMGNYCMTWIFEDKLSFIQSNGLNTAFKYKTCK